MKNPPHPGEVLKYDYMEPLGITVTELARALNMSRKNLSQIINSRTGISPNVAIRLSKAFRTTPMYWHGMQREFDLAKALNNKDLIDSLSAVELVS